MTVQVINQRVNRPITKSSPLVATFYRGFSYDTKPTDCTAGSIFKELDKNVEYEFDGTSWWISTPTGFNTTSNGEAFYVNTISLYDYMNYEGKVFTFSKTNTSVANNGYFDVRIKAGTKNSYIEIFYTSEGKSYLKTYLNTTYSAIGTQRIPFPRNTNSTYSLSTSVYEAPTIQTLGSARGNDFIGASSGGTPSRAGGSSSSVGTILKPNDDLLIRLQNVSGNTSDLNLIVNIMEI